MTGTDDASITFDVTPSATAPESLEWLTDLYSLLLRHRRAAPQVALSLLNLIHEVEGWAPLARPHLGAVAEPETDS
jgi:hypothetical protein